MATWHGLGEVKYRKWAVYDEAWVLQGAELDPGCCRAATMGGPVAIIPRQLQSSSGADREGLGGTRIFDMSGKLLGVVGERCGVGVVALGGVGWVESAKHVAGELLLAVEEQGLVHAFSPSGERYHGLSKIKLTIPGDSLDAKVVFAKVFPEGILSVLGGGRVVFYSAELDQVIRLNEGRPALTLAKGESVICASVSLDQTQGLAAEQRWAAACAILATNRNKVYRVTELECSCMPLSQGSAKDDSDKVQAASNQNRSGSSSETESDQDSDSDVGTSHKHESSESEPSQEGVNFPLSNSDKSQGGAPHHILRMAIAPNGRFLACFAKSGWLTVCNSNFTKTVLEFDTKAGVPPLQLAWCGEDCVVMQWRELGLLMVGPYGDWVKFTYSEPVHIVQEIDSLRIISTDQVELLQRVHPSLEAIRKVGSLSPSALLCDAADALERGDPKADLSLQAIKEGGSLVLAVEECIQAAKTEFDVQKQQELLRAASLGKIFCDQNDEREECAQAFVVACNALRTLNVVRHQSVALPLTIQQLTSLGTEKLVSRLVWRKMHRLALTLCSYLGLSKQISQAVLTAWAIAKLNAFDSENVQKSRSESSHSETNNVILANEVAERETNFFEVLRAKLAPYPGIQFAKLSKRSHRIGKYTLARHLALAEPISLWRALQLLYIGDAANALAHALHANDQDLALYIILVSWSTTADSRMLRRSRQQLSRVTERYNTSPEEMLAKVCRFPAARRTLVGYVEATGDAATEERVHQVSGRYDLLALQFVRQGYQEANPQQRIDGLAKAAKQYGMHPSTSDDFSSFAARMVTEQIKLLETQRELEKLTGKSCFVENSLLDTIYNCFILQLDKKAEEIKATFKCSEKAFWLAKVKALAQLQDWTKMRETAGTHAQFGESRNLRVSAAMSSRQPLRAIDFVDACCEVGNLLEAKYYIDLVKDPQEKLEALVKISAWKEAVEIAVSAQDLASLQLIRNKCDDDAIKGEIAQEVRAMQLHQS